MVESVTHGYYRWAGSPGIPHRAGCEPEGQEAGYQELQGPRMHDVLNGCTEVVYADLNLKLNLLWVSVKPRYGVISEICAELQHVIPESKLVGSYSG